MRRQSLRGSSLATLACVLAGSLALSACATMGGDAETPAADAEARTPLARGLDVADVPDPFPSTDRGLPRENMAIVGGTVFTVSPDGKLLTSYNLIASRRIQVGYGVVLPEDKTPRNIGIEAYRIPTEVRQLVDDARYWVENKTYL